MENVNATPSISLPVNSKLTGLSSSVVSAKAFATGGSFTGLTVKANEVVSDRAPSVTITVMSAIPFQFGPGVRVNVSLLTEAVTYVSAEDAEYVKVSSSISVADKVITLAVSSLVV